MFWTVPISSDSVDIELGAGRAKYALDAVDTLDFHDIVNDLQHGPSVPVTASFQVQWSEKTRQFQKRNAAVGFRGEFVETAATMEWSASEAEIDFVSAPAYTSSSLFAMLGQEHNGVFF